MEQFLVTGMSCAACQARIEKAVSKVEGVTSCAVSLLTNSMGVEGRASAEAIIEAVKKVGYGASRMGQSPSSQPSYDLQENLNDNKETQFLKRRLWASLCFLGLLMYLTMGRRMLNFPVPGGLGENPVAMGLLEMILAAIVMVINQKFFISGFKSLIGRSPNMDTLVALGSGVSFIWSVYILFTMTDAQLEADVTGAEEGLNSLYFESAAMILTLITVGKLLEARSKGKTTDALKGLMKLAPATAVILEDGKEKRVDASQVKIGDIFIVKPGESIPADGIVVEGESAVNESALTGESIPADKEAGDRVSAATINQSGYLKCQALGVGENTTLSQIIRMVSDAAATKAPIAKIADRVSGVFVPVVITIALVTIFIWLLAGRDAGFALARGISVLVISCPCALGLATPVAIMVGNGVGAKNGILFKSALSLEIAGKTQILAFDKTGTITKGEPVVTDVIAAGGLSEEELLAMAGSLEKKSEHPLARAVIKKIEELKIRTGEAEEFQSLPGNGLQAVIDGERISGGSLRYISEKIRLSDDVRDKVDELSLQGKTPLLFTGENRFLGIIAVADVIKEDSPRAIEELKNMGIRVIMLTGDNEKTARAIGEQAGVDQVIAGLLPNEKEEVIRSLKEFGSVTMVGDGINDAPALTRADIGIAIGNGTDIAIDAADVVLMKNSLADVPAAIRLSRQTLRNIHENLFWAFFYNIIGIPLAAGLWIPLFGWELNPMFGAAAMSLSSFCVVSNALRLNLFKLYDAGHDKKKTPVEITVKRKKEEKKMTKTMKIEGLMCPHCESAVKGALEALEGVKEAVVSHETGTALVTLTGEVDDAVLKKAVEDKDYKVTGIN